jgi:hypothetical protein
VLATGLTGVGAGVGGGVGVGVEMVPVKAWEVDPPEFVAVTVKL